MEQIPISDIKKIPIYTLIISESKVRKLAEQYKSGQSNPKTILTARLPDNTIYIIDNLDVFEAAKRAELEMVPCILGNVESYTEALEMYLDAVQSLPHDPFAILDAVNEIRKTDPAYEFPSEEYARLNELKISDDAKHTFRDMLLDMSNENVSVPSFWHLFKPISQLDANNQSNAVKAVMKFTKIQGMAPDTGSLKTILRQFSIMPTEEKTKTVEILPPDENTKVEKSVDGNEVAGIIHDPENHMVTLTCKCGVEWFVDVKNLAVREVMKSGGITLYHGDTGSPVYSIPHEYASYLGIDIRASTFYKKIGDAENPCLVVSADPLDEDMVKKLNDIIKEA